MISYEINLICENIVKQRDSFFGDDERCESFLVSEPLSRINRDAFIKKSRKLGWQVSSTGKIAFCPVCLKYLEEKRRGEK